MVNPRKKMRREKPEFEQRLLDLRRVTRVVKGGRRFRFRATVVIVDRRGKVGIGVSKGSDVTDAISKAYTSAKKSVVTVPIVDGTIPHDISIKLGSAKIILKPAAQGRGLIAGGAVRSLVDLAGIRDITSKSLGTSNKLNVARATLLALEQLQKPAVSVVKQNSSARDASVTPQTTTESLVKEDNVTEKKTTTPSRVRKSVVREKVATKEGVKKEEKVVEKKVQKTAPKKVAGKAQDTKKPVTKRGASAEKKVKEKAVKAKTSRTKKVA